MNTLLLNPGAWDLTVDVNGNIALAQNPYAVAQDVASACRLFKGELWYDNTKGIPYFERILGKLPTTQFLKAQYVAAAKTVPEVDSAKCFLTSFEKRTLVGQVQSTLISGATVVSTGPVPGVAPWYSSGVSPQAAGVGGP